jgi:hypothetical protein
MNKFINLKEHECGFSYTFDNSTTQNEFKQQMELLGMNDWRVFGTIVYFYRKRSFDDEEDEEDESDYELEEDE